MIKIRRINNFFYDFGESDAQGIKQVAKILTFENPDIYAYSNEIVMFNRKDLTFRIGMLNFLLKSLKKKEILYEVVDYEYNDCILPIDERLTGKYVHQQEALNRFFKKRFGILEVPTRGGKTFILSEIIRNYLHYHKGNFLIIEDGTVLFEQIISDIQKYFSNYNGIKIGRINAENFEVERVTVAMIQTIQSTLSNRCKDKKKKIKMFDYLKNIDFLAIDEIHDNFSDKRLKIYNKSKNINFLLCLSATPYREDINNLQKNLKLKSWSGDIIYSIKESELIEREILTKYKVFFIYRKQEEILSTFYADVRKEVFVDNAERDKILIDLISFLKEESIKTLVLFQIIEHGRNISEKTGFPFLSGVDKTDYRIETKDYFLSESGGILLASNIFKKGITLPQVEVLINVDGGLESSNTIQKKGRVLGFLENKKKSLIIDFFDDCEYFDEHSANRYNTYLNQVGEDNVNLFDEKEGIEEIKEQIHKWLRK